MADEVSGEDRAGRPERQRRVLALAAALVELDDWQPGTFNDLAIDDGSAERIASGLMTTIGLQQLLAAARREGWDAALAAVREAASRYWPESIEVLAALDRLAAEGPQP